MVEAIAEYHEDPVGEVEVQEDPVGEVEAEKDPVGENEDPVALKNENPQIFVEEFQVIEEDEDLLVPLDDFTQEDEAMTTEDVFVEPLKEIRLPKVRRIEPAVRNKQFGLKKQLETWKKYKCLEPFCKLRFLSLIERDYHMKTAQHGLPYQIFDCYCGKEFKTFKGRFDHMRTSHNLKFHCNVCKQVFFIEFAVKKHIKENYGSGYFTAYCLTKVINGDNSESFG